MSECYVQVPLVMGAIWTLSMRMAHHMSAEVVTTRASHAISRFPHEPLWDQATIFGNNEKISIVFNWTSLVIVFSHPVLRWLIR